MYRPTTADPRPRPGHRRLRLLLQVATGTAAVFLAYRRAGYDAAVTTASIAVVVVVLDLRFGIVVRLARGARALVANALVACYQAALLLGRRQRVAAGWVPAGDWPPVDRNVFTATPVRRRLPRTAIIALVMVVDLAAGTVTSRWWEPTPSLSADRRYDAVRPDQPELYRLQEDGLAFRFVFDEAVADGTQIPLWYPSDTTTPTTSWSRDIGRRTWQPAEPEDVVVVVGGSSAFGTGQGDDATVASELSRVLAEQGTPSTVYNFAVPGYTIHQSAVDLEQRLATGIEPPDVVVAYGGFNEAVMALYGRRVPTTMRELLFAEVSVSNTVEAALDRSLLLRVTGLRTARTETPIQRSSTFAPLVEIGGDAIEQAVVNTEAGLAYLERLAATHGFEVVLAWPASWLELDADRRFAHPPITTVDFLSAETVREVLVETSAKLAERLGDRFVSTQPAVLDASCFIDVVHTVGRCSRAIAETVAPLVAELLDDGGRR